MIEGVFSDVRPTIRTWKLMLPRFCEAQYALQFVRMSEAGCVCFSYHVFIKASCFVGLLCFFSYVLILVWSALGNIGLLLVEAAAGQELLAPRSGVVIVFASQCEPSHFFRWDEIS